MNAFLNNLIQKLTEFNEDTKYNCIFSFTKTNNETLKITIEWENKYKINYLMFINYHQYENEIFDLLKNKIINHKY